MPHPSRVLPHKAVLREICNADTSVDVILDQEQLIRVLCSQQLRFDRSLEEHTQRIIDHVDVSTQTILRSVTTDPYYEPAWKDLNGFNGNGHAVACEKLGFAAGTVAEEPFPLKPSDCWGDDVDQPVEQPAEPAEEPVTLNRKSGSRLSSSTETDYSQRKKKLGALEAMALSVRGWEVSQKRDLLLSALSSAEGFVSRLGYIVLHPIFDSAAALVIILNSALMAAQVQWIMYNDEELRWMTLCSTAFTIFFIVELALRMTYYGRAFVTSEDNKWNFFDAFLVAFSIFELSSDSSDVDAGSAMKTVKMVRVVRIFRVFRFFRELSLMALMIAESLRSLLWAWCLISIIMFTFSICITQATADYLKSDRSETEDEVELARRYFGGLMETTYSLTQAIIGGKSWGEFTDVLLYVDKTTVFLFLCYIVFMIIAVLNVITGVFVDNAVATASKQREFLITQELNQTRKYVEEMQDIFSQIDTDNSGDISLEEAKRFLANPKWNAYSRRWDWMCQMWTRCFFSWTMTALEKFLYRSLCAAA